MKKAKTKAKTSAKTKAKTNAKTEAETSTKADPSTHHPQAEEYAWGPVRSG
jgi:hypothetical protein